MLTSDQFADAQDGVSSPNIPATPERALMLAVFGDAINCMKYEGVPIPGRRISEAEAEAREWMWSTDSTYLFSFEPICAILGFDPQAIRERYGIGAKRPCQPTHTGAPRSEREASLRAHWGDQKPSNWPAGALSTSDVCIVLDLSPDEVNQLARRGELAAVKFSRWWTFRSEDVEVYRARTGKAA